MPCRALGSPSTVRFGGHVRGLLREWSELWPAGYSLIKLKEELWTHVVLRGLGPSFQHIRNGYAGAKKQDATHHPRTPTRF
jgi:hypothetical protein